MSVAFWYPDDKQPWHGSGHYSVNCDWVPFEISSGSSLLGNSGATSSWSPANSFSLFLSVAALCSTVFLGYYVLLRPKHARFRPMEMEEI